MNNETPQNSPLREVLKKPIDIIVKNIDEHTDFTPNQLSVIGAILAVSPILYKVFAELKGQELSHASNILLTLFFLSGVAIDGLDGSLARFQQSNGKANGHTPEVGQLVDGMLDRSQESVAAILYMMLLEQRGNSLAAKVQALAALTNPMGSYVRALNESNGGFVKENGSNILELLGTRVGRSVLGLSVFLPKDSPTFLQTLPSVLQLVGNIATITKRTKILLQSNDQDIDHSEKVLEKISQAKTRKDYYLFAVIATALATIVTQRKLRK